jgi:hypothetical protein
MKSINKKESKTQLTKKDIETIIARKAYDTPIGQKFLYRLHSLIANIGTMPSDAELEWLKSYAETGISNEQMKQLCKKWITYYRYDIDLIDCEEKKKKKLFSVLKKISPFTGWKIGYHVVELYFKKKIPSLKKYYVGTCEFMDTNRKYVYDEYRNEFLLLVKK